MEDNTSDGEKSTGLSLSAWFAWGRLRLVVGREPQGGRKERIKEEAREERTWVAYSRERPVFVSTGLQQRGPCSRQAVPPSP